MRRTLLACTALLCLAPLAGSADTPAPAKRTELESAVDKALAFLAANQEKDDGSWKAGRGGTKNPAITSLAVMAFLSAGHVPGEGPYGETVEKGVRWVLSQQQANGLIATEGGHEMYHHGISTIMLAEVAGMTQGKLAEEVRKKLEKAVAIILKAQRTNGADKGGWRYRVAAVDGSDISVTGWQVMALRAAKNVGCDVPPDAIDRAVEYIKRCQDTGTGGFRYTPQNGGTTIPCTGTSILALELCGKDTHHSDEALKAGAHLLKNLPKWNTAHFFYSVYYCSQATFQLGDNYWNFFRPHMHEQLLQNQNKENGCWAGGDYDGQAYGANYCTAMGVLALTVEYRFLPIYQRGEEPTDKDKGK
jgi:Prenyltransferase and squalene oxidase repeat